MATFSEAPPGNKDGGAKIFKTKCSQCYTVELSAGHKRGLSNETPISKDNGNDSMKSRGGTNTKVAIILIAVAAVVLFSFFLFKLWQKKKREEQYARLLKLFEEDDELEVELGLRD